MNAARTASPRSSASAKGGEVLVSVDGHRIRLTNLEKVIYPESGTTKADVLRYYAEIAEVMLPYTRDRAATRKRWVNGVGTAEHPGQMFFQKNLDDGTPTWVRRRTIEHSDHDSAYPLVNDRATLTWLAQIAALELHVPQWKFGRTGTRKNPDRLVLDLDPGEGVGLAECAEVARLARSILQGMGLNPMPVTSGSKGIHLYAALDGTQTSDEVSAVAHELARVLEADSPDLVVSDMKKTLRQGKVLVDWSQNNGSKTTIAPYSLRGRAHPMVAAPRTWRELSSASLAQLDYLEVLARVKKRGDPLAVIVESAGGPDRLHTYRSKRDQAKTPEPVPDARPAPGDGNSFVIQKHQASRLHYDFRLEHDGVLVSWALPKGVPTETKVNHLAVQTEDHPLEYGSFAGTIPKGEYGGGTVEIWDGGTYDLEKWRDGKEIIATLHGTKEGGLGGDRRFALIHTGSGGGSKADQNWLIHLMEPQYSAASERRHARLPVQPDDEAPAINEALRSKRAGASVASSTSSRAAAAVSSDASAAKPKRASGPATPISPMLATLGRAKDLTPASEWAYEMKWDGIRAITYLDNRGLRLLTRNGIDVTATYPDLLEALREAAGGHELVLDGEIVALDAKGGPSFSRLQQRMNVQGAAEVKRALAAVGVHYLVFDILNLDGASLLRRDYDDRRVLLEDTVKPDARSAVQVPAAFAGDFEAAFAASARLGLEGVMAKRHDSTYAAGKRSRSWIKIKHHLTQEVVIGGWRPGAGRRADGVGSLLLGVPENGGLRYVGRVGTGFSDAELTRMAARFEKLARTTSPFAEVPRDVERDARWVKPELVGEVEFAEWTASDNFRQASWRGWRTDKSAADVVRES